MLQQVASQNTSMISAHVNGSLNQCRCQLLTDLSSQVNKTRKNFSDLTYVFLNVFSWINLPILSLEYKYSVKEGQKIAPVDLLWW